MSTPSEAPPPHPPVRRVVTGHTSDGKSVVIQDSKISPVSFKGSPSFFSDLYWTDTTPADNGVEFHDLIEDHHSDLTSPNGSILRVVELGPGKDTLFHRTVSIDYGIVMYGTITLKLDNDERVVLNAGDVIIQRGTIHSWHNESTEWTRMYFVLLPSKKVEIGETKLDEEFRR